MTITGSDNKVGTELTASVTGNTHILAYQWYRNSVEIAGATNKTYTLAAVDAGTQISVKVTSSGNYEGVLESGPITVYKPSQVTTYVTAVEQTENGTVTVSPKNVPQGSTVTLTDEGYELDTLTVTNKNGSEMKLTPQDNGTYTFTMPAGGVDVEAAFYCTGSELCSSHGLTDTLVKAWYHDAVDYVVEQGIMTGTSATTFEPNATLNRAMVAQILYNLEEKPAVTGTSTFTDVDGHWALDPIAWAQETGVVNGYGNNTFQPNKAVSREELAQMLYNYAQYKGINLPPLGDLSQFPDGDKVSSWAQTAMSWANGLHIINGYEDSTLRPTGSTIRAEAATMIMEMLTMLAQ